MKKISKRQQILMDRLGLKYTLSMSMSEASRRLSLKLKQSSYVTRNYGNYTMSAGDNTEFVYDEDDSDEYI